MSAVSAVRRRISAAIGPRFGGEGFRKRRLEDAKALAAEFAEHVIDAALGDGGEDADEVF